MTQTVVVNAKIPLILSVGWMDRNILILVKLDARELPSNARENVHVNQMVPVNLCFTVYIHFLLGCSCTDTFDPVCGVNGMDYPNPCEATCKGTSMECKGSCPCGKRVSVPPPTIIGCKYLFSHLNLKSITISLQDREGKCMHVSVHL